MIRPQSCCAVIRVFDNYMAVQSASDVAGWRVDEAWVFGYAPQEERCRNLLHAICPALTASRGLLHVDGVTTDITRAADDVFAEVDRQDEKWGKNRDLPDYEWLAILVEEVGEAAQAALQTQYGGPHAGTLRGEVIQVGAVALQWIASIKRKERKQP